MGTREEDILAYVGKHDGCTVLQAVNAAIRNQDGSDDMAGFAVIARLVKAGRLSRVATESQGKSLDRLSLS